MIGLFESIITGKPITVEEKFLVDNHREVLDDEKVIGVLDGNLKEIYGLCRQCDESIKEHVRGGLREAAESSAGLNTQDFQKEYEVKVKCKKIAEDILKVSLQARFGCSGEDIRIRKGWKVVRYENPCMASILAAAESRKKGLRCMDGQEA